MTNNVSEAPALTILLLEVRLHLATLITLFAAREGVLEGMTDEQFSVRMDELRSFVMKVNEDHQAYVAREDGNPEDDTAWLLARMLSEA